MNTSFAPSFQHFHKDIERYTDMGGVLEVGARLRASGWLGVQLGLSNYFYSSQYAAEGRVFRRDLLVMPGLVLSWR